MIALRKSRIRRFVKFSDSTCVPPTCLAITSLAICTTICPVGPSRALLKVPVHVFSSTSLELYTGASTIGEFGREGKDFSSIVEGSIPIDRTTGIKRTQHQEMIDTRRVGDAMMIKMELRFTVHSDVFTERF